MSLKAAINQGIFATIGGHANLSHRTKKNNEILARIKEVLPCLLKGEIFWITTYQRENVV